MNKIIIKYLIIFLNLTFVFSIQDFSNLIAFTNKNKIETFFESIENSTIPNTLPLPTIQNEKYLKFLSGITYDWKNQIFFYTEFSKASIHSINFNNQNPNNILNQNQSNTYVIYYDPHENYLYATIYNEYTIIRLNPYNLQNSPEIILRLSSLDKFRGLAIDPCEKIIFWTNGNNKKPCIQKSFTNGQNIETIIETDIEHPRTLAIDIKTKQLYWGDRNLFKIEEINFDGKKRRIILNGISKEFFGITISLKYIYWTDRADGTISRIDRNSGKNLVVVKQNLTARGIIFVSKPIELHECDRRPNLLSFNKNDQELILDKNNEGTKNLTCEFVVGRSTKVKWIHNQHEISESFQIGNLTHNISIIHFKQVKQNIEGNYSCIVSNDFDTEYLNYSIRICSFCAPKIDKSENKIVLFKYQKNAIVSCKYKSIIKSNITWTRDEPKALVSESFPTFDGTQGESVIKISQVDENIGGFYNCAATNKFGIDSFKFLVEIQEEISNDMLIYVFIGTGILITILIFIVAILWKKYKIKRDIVRKLTEGEIKEFFEGHMDGIQENDNDSHAVAVSLPFDTKMEISMEELRIFKNTILGQGEFGIVYRGEIKGCPVAVKTLKPKVELEYVKAMMSELKIMAYIGDHPNILKFQGAHTSQIQENIIYAVVEFSPLGDLHSFLKKNRSNIGKERKLGLNIYENDDKIITEKEFLSLAVNWSMQIASGMKYLAIKKVVHGDLAARNILMFLDNVVKISDFGLSKQLLNYSKYIKKSKSPLPFRWLALESLRFREFTCISDVWAYGVTIWEIFSIAEFPYSEYNWTNEFVDTLREGMRLSKPALATDEIYLQMVNCWHPDVKVRARIEDLYDFFKNLLNKLSNESIMPTERRYANSPKRIVESIV